jgi:hypothetical protein
MFDPKDDYNKGVAAGRDAGFIQEILHDAIPFSFSESYEAGFRDGLADRDEE